MWMQTFSGRRVDLLDTRAEQLSLIDITRHLAGINRFTGATFRPWNVAQHSALVRLLLPDDACPLTVVWALAHDFHEAVIGDISTPVKWAIAAVVFNVTRHACNPVNLLADEIDRVVRCRFNLPHELPEYVAQAVKRADLAALQVERRRLMSPEPEPWNVPDYREPVNADRLFAIAGDTTASGLGWSFQGALRDYRASLEA